MRRIALPARLGLSLLLIAGLLTVQAPADTLTLKDGRKLRGSLAPLQSVAQKSGDSQTPGGSIVMVDDGLRRILIAKSFIQELRPGADERRHETYAIEQAIPENGSRIASAGPILRITPFDAFGRRILTMQVGSGKRVDVIQGITQITPVWTEVRSMSQYLWEQRIATSSIPRETLTAIFKTYTDPKKLDQRLKVVRLYLQSERYQDARTELAEVLKDFPDQHDQLAAPLAEIQQLGARRILSEIEVRADAGQHALSYSMLEKFPTENVAGEILQDVRERLEKAQGTMTQGIAIVEKLNADLALVESKDPILHPRLKPVIEEIALKMNFNTLGRMAAYERLWDDPELSVEEKLALAVSGWLLGADFADRDLSTALGLYTARELIRKYINAQHKHDHNQIVADIRDQKGADLERLSRLIANMKPPLDEWDPKEPKTFYELQVQVPELESSFNYTVQLPPEYDPYRRYPVIVTLHGAVTTPENQISWWAGDADEAGARQGQAMRHGYIIVAPAWGTPHQKEYKFESREHLAVLHSLRDACRRFSIDTDRVFLTGHSMGGVAAWDIGLAHPDLWAGVIPIVAQSEKFILRYWKNAKGLPLYFVGGELDGNQMVNNAADFDRYLRKPGYRCTVSEFRGRGHENFSDEILNLFDWMGRQKRDFFPKEFQTVSMRTLDNFFWWVELSDMPENTQVDPADWPPPRGTKELTIKASSNATNGLNVTCGSAKVTVWLSPEMIDFKQKSQVMLNGKKMGSGQYIEASLEVLLEDMKTRSDRQHPFWAKLESPSPAGVARGD